MNRESIHDTASDPRIDRALQSVGSATPAPGFDGRILNRVAAARTTMDARASWISRISALPRLPRQVLGIAAACLLGCVVIAGSVSHSRRIGAEHGAIAPPLPAAGQGIGAASAVHPAAPASTPAPVGQPGRVLRSSRHGRARIAPHSRKAPGAVPAPPASRPASDSEN